MHNTSSYQIFLYLFTQFSSQTLKRTVYAFVVKIQTRGRVITYGSLMTLVPDIADILRHISGSMYMYVSKVGQKGGGVNVQLELLVRCFFRKRVLKKGVLSNSDLFIPFCKIIITTIVATVGFQWLAYWHQKSLLI